MPRASRPVDEAGDGDGLDFEDVGEFLLQEAGLGFEADEDGPLGARHAVGAGALVGGRADEAGEGDDVRQQVALGVHVST